MLLRLLVLFHTVAVAGFFGQTGMFGPVVTNPRAGDLAPDLVFSNVLSSPGSGAWSSSNFLGHMTVLVFFPDTTYNLQSVSRGNALNSRFSGKPVQFVWITAEEDSSLLPWLQEHPIQGWVLHDPFGGSGRACGLELPNGVIIADRKILGFDMGIAPEERTISAALEG
ncbi:MAG TPA: hypothetical protein VMH81_23960 [Bryobacteraceae bacterium]|nr:hypothetical protein [Bryobacteraceae bacterium]